MVDTFHPLQLTKEALDIENDGYVMSWAEEGHKVAVVFVPGGSAARKHRCVAPFTASLCAAIKQL